MTISLRGSYSFSKIMQFLKHFSICATELSTISKMILNEYVIAQYLYLPSLHPEEFLKNLI